MIYICFTFDVERDWASTTVPYLDEGKRPLISFFDEKYSFKQNSIAIPRILNLFKRFGVKGDFFITKEVAINESKTVNNILSEGHNIGVHVHPYSHQDVVGKFDIKNKKKDLLAGYVKNLQKRMISDCKRYVEAYTKSRIFRSGKLSFNVTTLEVIKELGFKLDSSVEKSGGFFMSRYWKNNISRLKPFMESNIIRVPSFVEPAAVDLRSIIKRLEMIKVYNKFSGPLFVTFLIHPSVYGDKNVNTKLICNNFQSLLKYLGKQKFEFITLNDILKEKMI